MARTYTVVWTRQDGVEQTCSGLTLRVAFARLRGAIRNSGPITVVSIKPDKGTRGDWGS